MTLTSVASATALVATQPVWAALIARARGELISGQVWLGIGVAVAGALLLTGADLSTSGRALLGDGLAVLGGAFAAAYMVAGTEVRQSVSTTTYTAVCYTSCRAAAARRVRRRPAVAERLLAARLAASWSP